MIYHAVIIRSLLLGLLWCFITMAQSQTPLMQKNQTEHPTHEPQSYTVCQQDGVAVGGNDLVSYRQENGPVIGSVEFSTDYNELTYHFSSESNLTKFRKDPKRFLPEYNGACAIALAHGKVICPDYDNFKIEDDRLLLFKITGFTNGRTLWDSMPFEFRKKADSNFLMFSNQ